jgi:hypothetical protein
MLLLHSTTQLPKRLPLLQVYDYSTAQIDIFEITAKPIIDAVLDGYNGAQDISGQQQLNTTVGLHLQLPQSNAQCSPSRTTLKPS